MLMLMGATEIVPGVLPMGISLISTCGGGPARLAASRLFPVKCQSVDGPASRVPVTLRSNFCLESVAFTTERIRNFLSGDSAANISSGYVGLPELDCG